MSMNFYNFNSFYIVTDIKEHQQNKQRLLDLIDIMPLSSIVNDMENISKTDWNLPKEQERKYLDEFYKMVIPYMNNMAKKLKCKTWNIDNGWFQVYDETNTHQWHVHEKSNYTNVYYLHLPDDTIKTEVYDVTTGKILNGFEVKEGQILTLPASVIHRSPVNKTNQKKVVIAFNSNFDEVDLTI